MKHQKQPIPDRSRFRKVKKPSFGEAKMLKTLELLNAQIEKKRDKSSV